MAKQKIFVDCDRESEAYLKLGSALSYMSLLRQFAFDTETFHGVQEELDNALCFGHVAGHISDFWFGEDKKRDELWHRRIRDLLSAREFESLIFALPKIKQADDASKLAPEGLDEWELTLSRLLSDREQAQASDFLDAYFADLSQRYNIVCCDSDTIRENIRQAVEHVDNYFEKFRDFLLCGQFAEKDVFLIAIIIHLRKRPTWYFGASRNSMRRAGDGLVSVYEIPTTDGLVEVEVTLENQRFQGGFPAKCTVMDVASGKKEVLKPRQLKNALESIGIRNPFEGRPK